MRILVDGDSTPKKELIFSLALEYGTEVHWVNNVSQLSPRGPEGLRLSTYLSDKEKDATDIVLMNLAQRGDILITGDLGLAVVVVSKGCAALSPRGQWYREEVMAQQLEFRHLRAAAKRRGQGHGGGPKAYQREDEQRLEERIRQALEGPDDPA